MKIIQVLIFKNCGNYKWLINLKQRINEKLDRARLQILDNENASSNVTEKSCSSELYVII